MGTIAPMMKVQLNFRAGTGPDRMDIPLENPGFEFIFGIGTGGLTPFEHQLAELSVGDKITLQLQQEDAQHHFEHLFPPVRGLFLDRPDLFLEVALAGVGPADSREVIRAMAEMTAHGEGGCGGGCGCGCS